ncbi:rRNA pseudouridine synthase [Streptomyces sp. NBC_01317]|uniref:pseudouridine synthase n=1 Tax=Streptomyces sp. NBC_01317 TaxID=2903822 RepID=UPI002E1342F1|nr:rRNA pseudouridine synthase [Streptomyces sp. NBC_01317]
MRSGNSNSGSGNRNSGSGSGSGANRNGGGARSGGAAGGRGGSAGGGRSTGGGRGGGVGRDGNRGGSTPRTSGSGWSSGGGRDGGAGRGARDDRGRDDRARDDRSRDDRAPGAGRDEEQKRLSRPRPEERRYDVGRSGATGGAGATGAPRGARGAAARGGAKGGPKPSQTPPRARRGPGGQARPRELDAKIEQRNRDRYADKPEIRTPRTNPGAEQEGERLQKVLARAGMGSRRACEELIEQSRVEVNGEIVLEQGKRVDVDRDEIKVDGLTVATQSHLFFALNKPAGVVSTMEDPDGRQSLGDYVTNRETRLFHVGRLDTETEGIILLTNHGELAHRLTHPRYGVKKIYLAAIQGPLPRDLGKRLKDGILLEDGYAKADHFRVVENTGKNYLVEVTLHEGRKHIVRRMLAEAGFPVDRLVRTSFGPIPLGDQKSGWLRRLTNTEVGMLMKEVGL